MKAIKTRLAALGFLEFAVWGSYLVVPVFSEKVGSMLSISPAWCFRFLQSQTRHPF